MDIAALLKTLAGMGDAGANGASALMGDPAGGTPSTGGGVGSLLSAGPASPQAGAPPQPAPQAGPPPGSPTPVPQPPPVTPPNPSGGVGDFLSRMVQKATTRDAGTGLSFVDKVGRIGAQMTDSQGSTQGAADAVTAGAAQRVAQAKADAKRQQLQQMADSLGMSPREKLIFQANPDAWVQANAKSLEPATVPGGDTRVSPGADPYTAPKVGQEGGEGYSATPGGMKDLGGLHVSPQQQAQDDAAKAQHEAMTAYHSAMVRIAQERVTKARTAAPSSGLPAGYVPR